MPVHGEFKTVTVQRSWSAATATGGVALILDTLEMGPIAFQLSEPIIDVLQRELATLKAQLTRRPGSA